MPPATKGESVTRIMFTGTGSLQASLCHSPCWEVGCEIRMGRCYVSWCFKPSQPQRTTSGLRMGRDMQHLVKSFCFTNCCVLFCHPISGSYSGVIIIINPLTARVVGAPQMILQPVFSILPCSPLPSGTCRTPGLSIP